ncbi:serine/threonine protein kinase [Streptomyces sp. NA02950]|uniref:serine/threonine-protein kinase n=1 Tax=Streptomyces sp. NA02950 TaxID=2742137 RepID=UPI00158FD436|nr:serine/threonine-protein kinase [Streptomyces sp. NA02950]QKV96755.1 serine/threonine protein kinase [Streptomyces sp. NA02950]
MRGGMVEVWPAYDKELGRRVVLKRTALDEGGALAFDRLRAEARALARFSHPHVVTLYDAVRVGRRNSATSWPVPEYVRGGSLDTWPPVPPELAACVGAQLADALAALHREGIVHCDIKPGNVVVTESGSAKLTNFGTAFRLGNRQSITPSAAIGYTPAHAAPEVVRGEPEAASDVFSLGATVYALVTGSPPGRRGRAPRTGADGTVVMREPADDGAETPELDGDLGPLGAVLPAMLRTDPAHRPGTAEVRALLEEAAGATDTLPNPADLRAVTTLPATGQADGRGGRDGHDGPREGRWHRGRPARLVRRHPRLIGAGAATVVLVAVLPFTPFSPFTRGGRADEDHSAPGPSSSKDVSAKDRASVFGDPPTADPCALADASALRRFGDTELDRDYGDFDRCDVLVTSDGNGVVDLNVDFDHGPPPELSGPAKTVGKVGIVKDQADGEACERSLVISGEDDAFVRVTAKQVESGRARLCDIADTATGTAVNALNRGVITRRSPELPATSLVRKHACELLDPAALEVVPGINADDPEVGYAGGDCDWSSSTRDLSVDLRFDRGQPLDAEDGTPALFSGCHAFVEPGDGEGTCPARVVYRSYADQDGQKAVETLHRVVAGDSSADTLCTMARKLARSAAALRSA